MFYIAATYLFHLFQTAIKYKEYLTYVISVPSGLQLGMCNTELYVEIIGMSVFYIVYLGLH